MSLTLDVCVTLKISIALDVSVTLVTSTFKEPITIRNTFGRPSEIHLKRTAKPKANRAPF